MFPLSINAQDRHGERHKDSRLNLRVPSHSATYATVSAWHHQPEKLILDSCGYEATVSPLLLSMAWKGPPVLNKMHRQGSFNKRTASGVSALRCVSDLSATWSSNSGMFWLSPTQYLGSMIIRDLRGIESTQDACAKIRVSHLKVFFRII